MAVAAKLVEATVVNLFGQYTHSVSFSSGDDYVIIYGPNGVGKTKFLEVVHAAQMLEYNELEQVPFESIKLKYSDGLVMMVRRERLDLFEEWPNCDIGVIEFEITEPGKQSSKWTPVPLSFYEYMAENERFIPIGNGLWEDSLDGERVATRNIYARFQNMQRHPRYSKYKPESHEENVGYLREFDKFRARTSSYLIDSQRLLSERYAKNKHEAVHILGRDIQIEAYSRISECSDRLKEDLKSAQTRHSLISQEIDRSFPSRVLREARKKVYADPQQIRERYAEHEKFHNRLAQIVPVDQSSNLDLPNDKLEPWALVLLDLYLKDDVEKFKPFDDLLKRIELFQVLLNKRLLNKRLEVTASDGIVVCRDDGVSLALDSLSTGEQHEIILMFDLLLNVKEGSTVLVDEPEISLHVAWQLSFIPDVQKIAQLVGFRFIVATHSPYIINDSWERAVDLGSPERFCDEEL